MNLAPIALFVYNRPDHTKEAVTALLKNKHSAASDLFIFSDGAKNTEDQKNIDEVRAYIKTINGFKTVNIIEQASNLGLANSIIAGVTKVVNQYGRIIVLEDDIIVHTAFLEYMNNGLQFFETNEKVASIHAYIYPLEQTVPDLFFLKGADCWGWATWRNRWQQFEPDGSKLLKKLKDSRRENEFDLQGAYPYTRMLERQVLGLVDSWAIRWHASMFLENRLSLYPSQTLVENYGQDGSGTHGGTASFLPRSISSFNPKLESIPVAETTKVNRKIRKALRRKYGTYSMLQPTKYFRFFMREIKRLKN